MTDAAATIEQNEGPMDEGAGDSATTMEATDNTDVGVSSAPPSKIIRVQIDSVIVAGARREIDPEAVADLTKSMSTIGLKTPITIRVRKTELTPDQTFTEHFLVAGLHRLEAARSLGWSEIDCFVLEGDETDARLWEIVENLHRKELTALERSVYVAEWVDLAKARSGQVVHKGNGGRPEGGVAEAARFLPVSGKTDEAKRKTVERSLKINSISPEAKKAAAAAGLADNQQALLAVATEPTKEAQLEKVAERATRKRAKPKKSVAAKATGRKIIPRPASTSFRSTESETDELQKLVADIGHDIKPDDLIIAPGSESAKARRSVYAVVRIPNSHPGRDELKAAIMRFRDEYNTQAFFKELPHNPHDQEVDASDANDDDSGDGE